MLKKLFIALIVILAGCLAVWVWAELRLREQAESNRERIRAHEQAQTERKQADARRTDGERIAPMRFGQEDMAWIEESIARMRQRGRLLDIQGMATLAALGAGFTWVVGIGIYGIVQKRRWESAARPALPGAGVVVQQLLGTTGRYEAREAGAGSSVVVDAQSARISFRNFSFITSFWRNPRQALVELDFNELLSATLGQHRGASFLHLRTTRGRVTVGENVAPFDELVRLLLDIAELNRASPEQYQAMLRRELKVSTPWYAWLILTGALAGVGTFAWWLWSLGG